MYFLSTFELNAVVIIDECDLPVLMFRCSPLE